MKKFLVFFMALCVAVPVFAAKGKSAARGSSRKAARSDEFKDSRDKQSYRLVKIDGREWFGDNLNFKAENSYCYDDSDDNCMAYGRLYTWEAAKKSLPGWVPLTKSGRFRESLDCRRCRFQCRLPFEDNIRLEGRNERKRYAQVQCHACREPF